MYLENSFEKVSRTSLPSKSPFRPFQESKKNQAVSNPNSDMPPATNVFVHPERRFFLFLQPQYHRATYLGIGAPIACQLVDINIVRSYSTVILEDARLKKSGRGKHHFRSSRFVAGKFHFHFSFGKLGRISIAMWTFSGMRCRTWALPFQVWRKIAFRDLYR